MAQSEAFRRQLDSSQSIVTYLTPESDVLQLAFGGISGGLAMPPFEFFGVTKDFPTKKIFVRDTAQAWYHGELPGLGAGPGQIADTLRRVITESSAKRVVTFGNSMGGYAAILFGCLLGVDEIVAFAPQTFIDRWSRLRYRDNRWSKELRSVLRARTSQREYFDLRRVLRRQHRRGPIHIHFDGEEFLDTIHAERLANSHNVILHEYRTGGHGLVRHLRETGELSTILLNALRP